MEIASPEQRDFHSERWVRIGVHKHPRRRCQCWIVVVVANGLGLPHTVATQSALVAAGWTPGQVRAQLAARRWRRWGYAIALHNAPLTLPEQWLVARVHGGPGALLTGFTAVEALGLTGWDRDVVDVLLRPGVKPSPRCPVPVRTHRVRDWTRVRRHRDGPVHLAPQALLVAAATFPDARPACGILAAGVQQGLVTAARLHAELEVTRRVRHRRALYAAVDDIAQGAHALSEIDFVRLCRRHRLPAPVQQAVRVERDGRRRYLDASWRRRDGRLVVVEVDGALHLSLRRWWGDQLRQNEIVLSDALVLRFPSVLVRVEPQLVADQLRRALGL